MKDQIRRILRVQNERRHHRKHIEAMPLGASDVGDSPHRIEAGAAAGGTGGRTATPVLGRWIGWTLRAAAVGAGAFELRVLKRVAMRRVTMRRVTMAGNAAAWIVARWRCVAVRRVAVRVVSMPICLAGFG